MGYATTKVQELYNHLNKHKMCQNSTFFHNKTLDKLDIEGMYLSITSTTPTHGKCTISIITSGAKLKPLPLRLGTK
jgi:hypothetical protein